jgi:hypothetical protein
MAFTNRNQCRSGILHIESTWTELSGEECSEVIVVGPADGVYISSRDSTIGDGDPAIGRSFFVPANEIMTFRGITNVTELSALRGASTSRNLHYRTQYFGSIIPIAS